MGVLDASRYTYDPSLMTESEWRREKANIPQDQANRFIPIPLLGFSGLNEQQNRQVQVIGDKSKQDSLYYAGLILRARLERIVKRIHSTHTTLQQLRDKQQKLQTRLLQVMRDVDCVRSGSAPLNSEEQGMRMRLKDLDERINKPTKLRSRILELQALLSEEVSCCLQCICSGCSGCSWTC